MRPVRLLFVASMTVVLLSAAAVCASKTFYNWTWYPVYGIRLTFSNPVSVTSYDSTIFPTQEPAAVTQHALFRGGILMPRGSFTVTWSGDDAVAIWEWLKSEDPAADLLPQYPVDSGIDYAHPELYLAQTEQSRISDPSVLDSLRGMKKGLAQLSAVYRWEMSRVEYNPAKTRRIPKVNVDNLLACGLVSGCTEFALVYSAIARELGYPAVIVHTVDIDGVRHCQRGEKGPFAGHAYVEVFLIDHWILVDSTAGEFVYAGYDLASPVIAGPGGAKRYILGKSVDIDTYGQAGRYEDSPRMVFLANRLDVTTVVYPRYAWKSFSP